MSYLLKEYKIAVLSEVNNYINIGDMTSDLDEIRVLVIDLYNKFIDDKLVQYVTPGKVSDYISKRKELYNINLAEFADEVYDIYIVKYYNKYIKPKVENYFW